MTTLRAVTRVDDPAVEPYLALRERDLAGRAGLFVAEGDVVVRVLLSGRSLYRAESLLISERRAAALRGWLEDVAARAIPVCVASQPVMDAIVGFPIHRGLLALGRRPAPDALLADMMPAPDRPTRVLGLVGLTNHDNVGSAFRNAAAFGVDAVCLDRDTCDPLYRKAIRVSAGAALTVPFARLDSADAMLAALVGQGCEVFGLATDGAERIEDVRWPRRAALLVGSEGRGLPPDLLGRVRTVRIAMAPGVDSLNVAAAAAIALHAAARFRSSD